MSSNFQVVPVPLEKFARLFSLPEKELTKYAARRMTVDTKPGYPCRVSLVDAEIGEQVILVPFKHHDVASPYQSVGPIFVREKAKTVVCEVNEIPLMLRHRLLSIRAYDEKGMMIGAKIAEGKELEEEIRRFFENERVDYLHLHNATPGCFNCRVQRPRDITVSKQLPCFIRLG